MTETVKKAGRKSREQLQKEMTDSPEFLDAVTRASAAAVEAALSRLAPQAARSTMDQNLLSDFAMHIAELTTQGSGKVKVSPEVMRAREDARVKMMNLIIEARAEKKVPTYHLRAKVFMNNQVIEPFWVHPATKAVENTELDFWGIPSDAMVPVNDTAKAIFQAYRDSLGTVHGVPGVANQLPNREDFGVTAGGLVVRNSAVNNVSRRRAPELPTSDVTETGPMASAYESEDTHDYQPMVLKQDQQKGQFKDVHVLGTIQQPARQTV